MNFKMGRYRTLLGDLQVLYHQLITKEYLRYPPSLFQEGRMREKYFKEVYEQFQVSGKTNEDAFMIGALAEYIFRSSPRDFEDRETSL